MIVVEHIENLIKEYIDRFKKPPAEIPDPYSIKFETIDPTSDWRSWSTGAGIYIIHNINEIFYVGRTFCRSSVRFGGRIDSHLKKISMKRWQPVLESRETVVTFFNFSKGDDTVDYMIAGLELFLIDELKPTLNYKRG
ncbi:MAG: hypothetical protein WBM02_08705 [bacterium]